MYVYEAQPSELETWIQEEAYLQSQLGVGASGRAVRRVQEWLTLHGYSLVIDESYGPVTVQVVISQQLRETRTMQGIEKVRRSVRAGGDTAAPISS